MSGHRVRFDGGLTDGRVGGDAGVLKDVLGGAKGSERPEERESDLMIGRAQPLDAACGRRVLLV